MREKNKQSVPRADNIYREKRDLINIYRRATHPTGFYLCGRGMVCNEHKRREEGGSQGIYQGQALKRCRVDLKTWSDEGCWRL